MKTKLKKLALVVISFSLMGNSSKTFEQIVEEENLNILEIYPPEDYEHNEYQLIEILARELKVDPLDLFTLIHFETAGTFKADAKNPNSSAKGMIQFIDATAITLKHTDGSKYKSSQDLIDRCSTAKCQLDIPNKNNKYGGPVYQYLSRFGKFDSKEKLFMAVFYPGAIGKGNFQFSEDIANVNGGITSVGVYVKLAEERMPKGVYYVD